MHTPPFQSNFLHFDWCSFWQIWKIIGWHPLSDWRPPLIRNGLNFWVGTPRSCSSMLSLTSLNSHQWPNVGLPISMYHFSDYIRSKSLIMLKMPFTKLKPYWCLEDGQIMHLTKLATENLIPCTGCKDCFRGRQYFYMYNKSRLCLEKDTYYCINTHISIFSLILNNLLT